MPIMRNYRGSIGGSQADVVKTFLLISLSILFLTFTHIVRADVCDGLSGSAQNECEENRDDLEKAKSDLSNVLAMIDQGEKDLSATLAEITGLQANIDSIRLRLIDINKNLEIRRLDLREKFQLRDSIVRAQYQSGRLTDLEFFLYLASNLDGFRYSTFVYIFDKSLASEALRTIDRLNMEISNFESDKASAQKLQADLEIAQQKLTALKIEIEKKLAEAAKEVKSLEQKIDELSAKQQAILAAKAGEGTVSGYEAAEYELPDSPYSPGFAAMSYGAYTHYNGMSQYGAKGRADAGDDYEEILEHYYDVGIDEVGDDEDEELEVSGYGKMSYQDYLYGIAEMPSSWNEEALKAQAVAARSYARRASKPICTSESCQVFLKSKSDNPPSSWKEAVDATSGEILNDPKTSQYSSTTGGYLNQSGWDTKDGGSGDWPGDAYEKKAKSPWFYKAWHTQTYRDNSSTCGRSTPWLDEEEMADILNAWRVWKEGSGDEREHISPLGGCWDGDPYSHGEMRDKADDYGNSYNSVSGVSVAIGNNGQTSSVTFQTNNGSVTIAGAEFKTVFNLRAPGYVSLRSRLFDIEMEN